jgi:hypothetical protein
MLKTVSSITNAIGALNYKGTWNASTNTPTLASGVGTKGDYYVVSVAGSTTLDGISNWGVGDWAAFNGSVWQRVEGGANLNGVDLSVSGTTTLSGLTASTALALNASKEIVSVTNTGTGNNVLANSPTLVTPDLGTPSALVGTNITGTANSLNAGIGVNQTWQSPARAVGTTYTNSSGKPITVAITVTCTDASTVQGLIINGATVYAGSVNVATGATGFSLIVPDGATYVTTTNAGTLALVSWAELR